MCAVLLGQANDVFACECEPKAEQPSGECRALGCVRSFVVQCRLCSSACVLVCSCALLQVCHYFVASIVAAAVAVAVRLLFVTATCCCIVYIVGSA